MLSLVEGSSSHGLIVRVLGVDLTDDQLKDLEAILSRASPGPWRVFSGRGIGGPDFIQLGDDDTTPDMYVMHDSEPAPVADLDVIAAGRNALPSLVEEIRRRRAGA